MEKTMPRITEEAARLEQDWTGNPRWEGIVRDYTAREVVELRGSIREEHTLARLMSEKLWKLITSED
jgi:isocitrate lyase